MKQKPIFDAACALIERVLRGPTRQQIIAAACDAPNFTTALTSLRDRMRSDVWKAGGDPIFLDRVVKTYDRQTREDGFHVLHDWDGVADKVNADTIPVDVLHYLIDKRGAEPPDATALAILLDYYFLHLLALLSVRIWDDGDADAHLDRLHQLLGELQGPAGSGESFVDNAETLILIATSHFELHERGYDRLLGRVKTLNHAHQTNIALGHAASMGSHLRFGFEATYGRDIVNMRNDNVADYPWLCFALATVMREYVRMREDGVEAAAREPVVEALLNGLSPDARAFIGQPPGSLSACEVERVEFRERFQHYRQDLVEEFERHRPSDQTYSPLSFFFNFSHNVLKGTVIDALLCGEVWDVSFNDLLTGVPRDGARSASRLALATTLMAYARLNPHRIRGRQMPVIVYDSSAGRQAFAIAMRKIKE